MLRELLAHEQIAKEIPWKEGTNATIYRIAHNRLMKVTKKGSSLSCPVQAQLISMAQGIGLEDKSSIIFPRQFGWGSDFGLEEFIEGIEPNDDQLINAGLYSFYSSLLVYLKMLGRSIIGAEEIEPDLFHRTHTSFIRTDNFVLGRDGKVYCVDPFRGKTHKSSQQVYACSFP